MRPILDVVLGPQGGHLLAAATRTAIPTRILMVATYAVKTLKTFTVIVSTLSIKTFMNNIHRRIRRSGHSGHPAMAGPLFSNRSARA